MQNGFVAVDQHCLNAPWSIILLGRLMCMTQICCILCLTSLFTPFISFFKSFQDWLLPSKQHWRNYHQHAPIPPSARMTASKLQDLILGVTTWYDSKTYSVTVPHCYYSITKYCVITPLKPRQCPAAPHKYTEVYSSSA